MADKYTYEEVEDILTELSQILYEQVTLDKTKNPDRILEDGISQILRSDTNKTSRNRVLFETPLKDIVLLLNDGSIALRTVAKWRIKIGK